MRTLYLPVDDDRKLTDQNFRETILLSCFDQPKGDGEIWLGRKPRKVLRID